MQRSDPVTESKTFDIAYPGAVAGVVTAETSVNMKSLEQMVADAGGSMETARMVRPDGMEYGYVPTVRD